MLTGFLFEIMALVLSLSYRLLGVQNALAAAWPGAGGGVERTELQRKQDKLLEQLAEARQVGSTPQQG